MTCSDISMCCLQARECRSHLAAGKATDRDNHFRDCVSFDRSFEIPQPGSAGFEINVSFVVARSSRWILGAGGLKKVAGALSQKAVKA